MTTGVLTSSIVTGINYAEITQPQSPWNLAVLPVGDIAGDGEVSFGVACGDLISIDFTSNDTSTEPDYLVEINIYANGVDLGLSFYLTNNDPDESGISISGLDVPCGSILTIVALAQRPDLVIGLPDDDGVLTVTAEITLLE